MVLSAQALFVASGLRLVPFLAYMFLADTAIVTGWQTGDPHCQLGENAYKLTLVWGVRAVFCWLEMK